MEEGRSAFKILTGKPTGKRPLGRPRRKWEDNIRMGLEEIGIKWVIGLMEFVRPAAGLSGNVIADRSRCPVLCYRFGVGIISRYVFTGYLLVSFSFAHFFSCVVVGGRSSI